MKTSLTIAWKTVSLYDVLIMEHQGTKQATTPLVVPTMLLEEDIELQLILLASVSHLCIGIILLSSMIFHILCSLPLISRWKINVFIMRKIHGNFLKTC